MNKYWIQLVRSARKELEALPAKSQDRILLAIATLQDDPRPVGSKKLKGTDCFRIRVGDYRVIYEVVDEKLLVLVLRIRHRKDAYQ